jgi:hypothetical protein
VAGDEDARVCKDIPSESCNDQPRNFFAYLGANTLNKVADEMSSARLVLPWRLGALGAPAMFTGFLVPIREAGVLLPQMAVAALVRHLPRRQPVWLLGALLSALALFGMAAAALLLDGAAAGRATVTLLVVFRLARGLCSVSAKDVLGKTVSKSRRGRLLGLVVSAAAYAGSGWLTEGWVHALIFMLLTVMHSGVRLGRKVYLVDMASADNRAAYVAVSNSVIGVAMLVGGLIGLLGDWLGIVAVIAVLSVASLLAAVQCLRLPEVSDA